MTLAATIQFLILQILCVMMVHISTGPGMIFYPLRRALHGWWAAGGSNGFRYKLLKPIMDCMICMSPWYGTMVWLGCGYDISWQMAVHVLAGGGLMWVIVRYTDLSI